MSDLNERWQHRDGDAANNILSNLRWATPQENSNDRVRHGHGTQLHGSRHSLAKLCDDDVRRMRLMRKDGVTFRVIADIFGVSASMAFRAISGERWRRLS
jgi:hypothetical protein